MTKYSAASWFKCDSGFLIDTTKSPPSIRGTFYFRPMTKKERVDFIIHQLERLYPHPEIPLDHKDAYTMLISVLLSAQCTDKRVNLTTQNHFKKADTPQKMIKLSVKEIEDIVRPCGLAPAKSKAIHRLSEILLEKHKGKVPDTFEDLEHLPGV